MVGNRGKEQIIAHYVKAPYCVIFGLNGFCVAWSSEDPAATDLSRHNGVLCPDSDGMSYDTIQIKRYH